ncbi:3-isopropylmalate dehydratase large subunit [Candidatus Poribacteria bacterium]|nr:3-isopropylmalate dehydratase large subunit [Candidatus Poribacteria bacterium]
MGMTITEKILAAHAGKKEVHPGELITCKLDLVMGNDVTAPISIDILEREGIEKVFDKDKIVLLPDHYAPNKDIQSAQLCKAMRDFAREHNIKYYFEVGTMGVEHALLPEQGIVVPGDCMIGADSHTCTYGALGAFSTGVGSTDLAAAMISGETWFKVPESMKFIFYGSLQKWVSGKDLILYTIGNIGVDGALYKAMEFTGETIENLSMESRLTMCNMAIEAGGKSGIIAPDNITLEYIKDRAQRTWKFYASDPDAEYCDILEYDASKIEPQVAFPYKPENARPISEVGNIPIDQAYIGSCTNGRIEDLRIAAQVLQGRQAHPYVRLIIVPATQSIWRQAMKEGLFDIFHDAGAAISTPTCGACLGGYMGVLADGEVCISTTNRNFRGRMGSQQSEVYLANPAIAAASAVAGRIASPEELN